MYRLKFLDGSPVDKAYEEQLTRAVSSACNAEELVGIDALEEFAAQQRATEVEAD